MLRWIGSILIISACSGIGFSKSWELAGHLQELEKLKKIFCLLKSEIHYTRAPFAEVFCKIAQKVDEPYKKWLQHLSKGIQDKTGSSFDFIWKQSIQEDLSQTKLREDELEELKNIGKNLEYTESLELYIEQLEYKIAYIRESNRSKRKLCQSMGIMGGIFLVILLL